MMFKHRTIGYDCTDDEFPNGSYKVPSFVDISGFVY